MQVANQTALSGKRYRLGTVFYKRPLIALALAVACMPLFLIGTVVMPIGPMYWDQYIYLDAANRIFDGQIPSVDFFAPVGGLGYYLFAAWLWLFPNGHALLLASWSLMTVTAPLMALIVWDVQRRSNAIAYALLLPFLLFSLLPFNTGEFYPFPGSDGFGIYNRQICQLLYVLAAALVFVRGQKVLATVTTLAMLALFFVKITGVASGVLLCLMAFIAGRLQLRAAIAAGASFFAAIGLVEVTTGMVSAYVADILSLLQINDTSLLPRLLQAGSLNFGIVLACCVLGIVLFFQTSPEFFQKIRAFAAKPGLATFVGVTDQSFLWLASFVAAGLLFESQNTGSQAFIFLWPLLLGIMMESYRCRGPSVAFSAVAVLALCVALPTADIVAQKSTRAWIGTVNTTPLEHSNLKSMGAVSVRDNITLRATRLRASYIEERATYERLASSGELPSFLLYSDFEFQTLWLQSADGVVTAIHAYEAANKVRFETIMTIDFTNPFAWLMDRHAPKHVAIGADPYRAVPLPDQRLRDAVGSVDLALYPTCPPTAARLRLLDLYAPILAIGHDRITLTPCFDAFVRKGLLAKP